MTTNITKCMPVTVSEKSLLADAVSMVFEGMVFIVTFKDGRKSKYRFEFAERIK